MVLSHCVSVFQSTLPVGGGTGGRFVEVGQVPISIHPPRLGRDWCRVMEPPASTAFQSTLPVGGGTYENDEQNLRHPISIHPPRVGRDVSVAGQNLFDHISIHPPRKGRDLPLDALEISSLHFNPPSPWGEGQSATTDVSQLFTFQSTLPARGGTLARLGLPPGS